MSALFGAAARAPFTAFVFAFELTGDSAAIVPLMIGGVTADVACRFLLKQSIMTERLARRGLHVPQEYEADPLRRITVGTAMTSAVDTVRRDMPLRELIAHIDRREHGFRRQGFAVIDEHGRLAGVITRSDLAEATVAPTETDVEVARDAVVADIVQTDIEVAYADELLAEALIQMVRRKIGRLPVVDRQDQGRLVGWLTRSDVFRAREHAVEEELVRERPIALRRRRKVVHPVATPAGVTPTATDGSTGLDRAAAPASPSGDANRQPVGSARDDATRQ